VKPAWILLDMGGVLVQVDAARRLDAWTGGRLSAEEFWPMWLASPAVKRFETGLTDGIGFAREAVAEFGLSLSPEAFLADFEGWLTGPYPGALEFLDRLGSRWPLACFSNSSCVHWPILRSMFDTDRRFRHSFPTCEMGVLKPEPAAFAKVLETLAVPAQEVWFFDDNQVNVEAARACGMQAWLVKGLPALEAALAQLLPETANAS
jgi:putative hydrolase of the HAD superfamily